jgi:hypothetical protein
MMTVCGLVNRECRQVQHRANMLLRQGLLELLLLFHQAL